MGGQMVQKIKEQAGGKEVEEGRQVVGGEETGDREILHLEVGGEMGEVEVGATLMRDLPGVHRMKEGLSEEDGEMWVASNPTRTGGVQSPTQQQHRYQTAKQHQ